MENLEAQKIINTIQQGVLKTGIVTDTIAAQLKELRPFAIEEEDPTLTKVIRLTYEHLDNYGSFNIPLPDDTIEEEDLEEMGIEETDAVELPEKEVVDAEDFEAKRDSLLYLLEIMSDARQKGNRIDLMAFRDSLMAYAEEHS